MNTIHPSRSPPPESGTPPPGLIRAGAPFRQPTLTRFPKRGMS